MRIRLTDETKFPEKEVSEYDVKLLEDFTVPQPAPDVIVTIRMVGENYVEVTLR